MTPASQNRREAEQPRINGKFAPGHSGNPGGRPKGLAARVREAMPEQELVAGMIKIAKGLKVAGQKPTIAEIMRAREWLADRGHGKAPAFAPIEGENPLELDDVNRELESVLDDLAARREARAAGGGEAPPLAGAGEG